VLHARRKNDDVASRVIFCALIGSALAIPLKYDNHLLGLVKVPRDSHPWADDVLMYVRVRAELFVRDEIANAALWAARNLAKHSAEYGHVRSPNLWPTFIPNAELITKGATLPSPECRLLALFGHGAMSDLSPLCAPKRTSGSLSVV